MQLRAKKKSGDQQPEQLKQLAPEANPPTPADASLALEPAAPALATTPIAPPTPLIQPATAPPAPASKTPVPEASASGASPQTTSDTRMSLDRPLSVEAGKNNFGQAGNGMGNRRALQADKSSQKGSANQVIAYRLRGLESLVPAKKAEQAAPAGDGGSGFGGGAFQAGPVTPELAKLREAADLMKADGVAQKRDAKVPAANNGGSTPAEKPLAEPAVAVSRGFAAQENKLRQQPPLQAESSNHPARMPTPGDALLRQEEPLAKVTAMQGAIAAAANANSMKHLELAKQTAPTPGKRVRVLFVIEHDTRSE